MAVRNGNNEQGNQELTQQELDAQKDEALYRAETILEQNGMNYEDLTDEEKLSVAGDLSAEPYTETNELTPLFDDEDALLSGFIDTNELNRETQDELEQTTTGSIDWGVDGAKPVKVYEDGTYFGEDGHIHAADGGVLFHEEWGGRGRGYVGYSMSVNMAEAQANNELPASKAATQLGVSIQAIREVLTPSAWHHASSYYNEVNVYDINPYLELKAGNKLSEDEYSPGEIAEYQSNWDKMKNYPKPEKGVKSYYGNAEWIEWEGTRAHPKPIKHKAENILIDEKGSFYTFHLSNGGLIRKKIGSNGTYVEDIEKKRQHQELMTRREQVLTEMRNKYLSEYENFRKENHLDKPDIKTFETVSVDQNMSGDNYYIYGQKPLGPQKEKGLRRIHQEPDKFQLQEWDGDQWQVLDEQTGEFKPNWRSDIKDGIFYYILKKDELYRRIYGNWADDEELAAALDTYENRKNENILFHEDIVPNVVDLTNRIQQIDKDRLLYERKDINPELKGRENEIVQPVQITRYFVDRKASKEISINDVLAEIDKTVAKNKNGVRVLKNSTTGENVALSKASISKMFNTASIRDNQNIGGILGKECIANIGKIFDTALLIKTTVDAKHGTKNKIRRYANAIISDGESFIVKITVKELSNGNKDLTDIEIEGNAGKELAAYDLKVGRKNTAGNPLGSFAKAEDTTVAHNSGIITTADALGNLAVNKSTARTSGNNISIDDFIDFVNTYTEKNIKINGVDLSTTNSTGERIAKTEEGLRAFYDWFGNSKVVDEQGRPLVIYHGTNADFDTFSGTKILNSSEGVGFNFTPNKELASGFGNVMPVYLNLKNPVYAYSNIPNSESKIKKVIDKLKEKGYEFYDEVYTDFVKDLSKRKQAQEVLDNLLDLGSYIVNDYDSETLYKDIRNSEIDIYKIDGYVSKNYGADRNTVYIAFSPNQIKSIKNIGLFNAESDNIFYQKSAKSIKRASYDQDSRVIQLLKDATAASLPHEFAHYWLDNITAYVNSGQASEAYLQNFYKPITDWLGKPKWSNGFSRAQHEKFASGYEKYLREGHLPKPILGAVFDDYDKWLQEVYESADAITISGTMGKKPILTPEIINFFQSMTTGKLETSAANEAIAKEAAYERIAKDEVEMEESARAGIQEEAEILNATVQSVSDPATDVQEAIKTIDAQIKEEPQHATPATNPRDTGLTSEIS